eukprot:15405063-Alexandrium_andersonii.AAC.1
MNLPTSELAIDSKLSPEKPGRFQVTFMHRQQGFHPEAPFVPCKAFKAASSMREAACLQINICMP